MAGVTNIVELLLGGAVLVAGRKLFWLLVGAIGFLIGMQIATRFFNGNEVIAIVAGVILGIIFALLAIFLESIAIAIAGFLGGGYVLLYLAGMLGIDPGGFWSWVVFAIGGILGIILVRVLFNWALIVISSLAGASMVVSAFGLTAGTATLIYVGLVVAGVLIQAMGMRREHPHAR
jgi:hypothetical protein